MDANNKKLVWASWDSVLASKQNGGLGVLGFYALNGAIMFKWVWRFKTQKSSLWATVIKALHGEYGHLDKLPKSHQPSGWIDIVRDVHILKEKGIDLLTYCKKKVGNGETSKF